MSANAGYTGLLIGGPLVPAIGLQTPLIDARNAKSIYFRQGINWEQGYHGTPLGTGYCLSL